MPVHDFCLLPVHAGLLALGGAIAYSHKGSKASLYGGLGTAAVLAVCSQLSYKKFKEDKSNLKPATAVSLAVSTAVTVGMIHNCKAVAEANKLAIAGAVISTAFTAFYAWSLFKDSCCLCGSKGKKE